MEYASEVANLRQLNEQALLDAVHSNYTVAYQGFMAAENQYHELGSTRSEAIMAGSDTLRDWAMTYARDAAHTEDPTEQEQLFTASDFVFDCTFSRAALLLQNPKQYASKAARQRGQDTYFVTHSVQARAHKLRKTIENDTEPWGDEPGFGAANAGLKHPYWAATNAMHALNWIRSKNRDPSETIKNSKSTLLHSIPWIGRAAVRLTQSLIADREPIQEKAQEVAANIKAQDAMPQKLKQLGKSSIELAVVVVKSRREFGRTLGHVARLTWSFRSKEAARAATIARP